MFPTDTKTRAFATLMQTAFPNPNEYSAFMGNFSSVTGTVTLVMMLLGRTIFQKFGWKFAALVTPTVRYFYFISEWLATLCTSLIYEFLAFT